MVGQKKKRVMDDLGNIIYVVIAIGWFFWNTYKKAKESKGRSVPKQPSRRPEPVSTSDADSDPFQSLEDMILGQLDGKNVPTEQPNPVVVPEYKNQEKFLNVDRTHSHLADDYQMSVSESKSHRVQRQVKPALMEKEREEEGVMDELFPEGFELQKAVVLNTILERPYA